MKLHIVHNRIIPNQIRKTEPELQEILEIFGKLLSVSALSYAICKIQSINITIKEMQNIVSLILKEKKLGRYLLGLHVSDICFTLHCNYDPISKY